MTVIWESVRGKPRHDKSNHKIRKALPPNPSRNGSRGENRAGQPGREKSADMPETCKKHNRRERSKPDMTEKGKAPSRSPVIPSSFYFQKRGHTWRNCCCCSYCSSPHCRYWRSRSTRCCSCTRTKTKHTIPAARFFCLTPGRVSCARLSAALLKIKHAHPVRP